jgi:hypothetical protein
VLVFDGLNFWHEIRNAAGQTIVTSENAKFSAGVTRLVAIPGDAHMFIRDSGITAPAATRVIDKIKVLFGKQISVPSDFVFRVESGSFVDEYEIDSIAETKLTIGNSLTTGSPANFSPAETNIEYQVIQKKLDNGTYYLRPRAYNGLKE